jgi:hypothetical protein
MAYFGSGDPINVSAHEDLASAGTGLTDYNFISLPEVGEGLICLNKTKSDKNYNMHLGAVVAKGKDDDGDFILISHMFEPEGDVGLSDLILLKLYDPKDFRKQTFGSYAHTQYAVGLLRVKK